MGGGLIPLPPARRQRGEGNLGPLKEEQVGGEEGGGGKRRPVEREELDGGAEGEPPRPPDLPHPPPPRGPGRAGGGYPGLPGATLKPRVLRSETKSSFFERSGCALELCDSARAGERGAGGDGRGRGGAARTPSPGLPNHALLLEAIPYPPLSRCGARAAVKVMGRTAQRRTGNSGPRGQPPHTPHTSRPPECNVTERRGGTPPPPVIPGVGENPAFGVQQGEDRDSQHPHHSARTQELGGPMQHPSLAPQEATGLECLGVPQNWGSLRLPGNPSAPPKFLRLVSPGNKSPPHVLPPPPPVSAGVFMLGGPGLGAPTPGRSSRRPRCPVPSRARRAALGASPGLASQSLSPPRRRLPG